MGCVHRLGSPNGGAILQALAGPSPDPTPTPAPAPPSKKHKHKKRKKRWAINAWPEPLATDLFTGDWSLVAEKL